MLTVKGMALNRVLQKWVWRPVMLWIIVMSLHSFIFILIVTCFKSDYCNFLPEIFRIIPLHIFSQHIEMFFSSVPQHLRWVPWVVVDLEQSIPPTREFPKTISSIKQTNFGDEHNRLPKTRITNIWMAFYNVWHSYVTHMRSNYYQGGLPIVNKMYCFRTLVICSYIEATLIYKLMQVGFSEPDERSHTEQLYIYEKIERLPFDAQHHF